MRRNVAISLGAGLMQWRAPTARETPNLDEPKPMQGGNRPSATLELKDLVDYSYRLSEQTERSLLVAASRAYGMLQLNMALTAALMAFTTWWLDAHGSDRWPFLLGLGVVVYLSAKGVVHALHAVSPTATMSITPDLTSDARAAMETDSAARDAAWAWLDQARRFHTFNEHHRAVRTEHANLALETSLAHYLVAVVVVCAMAMVPSEPKPACSCCNAPAERTVAPSATR